MSYTKQTWQAGDEITSAKLNHMEDGINDAAENNGVLLVNAVIDSSDNNIQDPAQTIVYLDKTYLEIKSAYLQGKKVIIKRDFDIDIDYTMITEIYESTQDNTYEVSANYMTFIASTEDEYPHTWPQHEGNPS